jgi:DNA-binding transcriptional regulator GbsR (MarR family)
MTEITAHKRELPVAVERFVLHWGEMGATWGVNRSVGQIHALLYLSDAPLTAEDIADTLGLARSNVSNSIKELLGWQLIRRVSLMGDRRDYYVAETDLWEMVTRIAEGRKARELDPTLALLRACARDAVDDRRISPVARSRITAMLSFVEGIDRWADDMRRVPRAQLGRLLSLGARIVRLLPTRARKRDAPSAD